jgi:hypothetical protein
VSTIPYRIYSPRVRDWKGAPGKLADALFQGLPLPGQMGREALSDGAEPVQGLELRVFLVIKGLQIVLPGRQEFQDGCEGFV